VPFFYVKATCVAVVPIRIMFGCVGVGCSCWLFVLCRHLIVWGRDIAVRRVVARGIIVGLRVASSSSLVPSASSGIASSSVAASVVVRLVVWLRVMG
jgi:hypothetical protein